MNSCRFLFLQVPLLRQTTQNVSRPGVGRASAGRQYQTYVIPPANVVQASARRTTPGRCYDFWCTHNRCPADVPRRPTKTGRCKIARPAGLVSSRLYALVLHPPTIMLWNLGMENDHMNRYAGLVKNAMLALFH